MKLRVLVAVAASAIALMVNSGAPANAAGSTSLPDIKGCFTWGSTVAYANQPVWLEQWNGSSWVTTSRHGLTASSGCIQFNDIAVGSYYRLYPYKNYGYPNCYAYYAHSLYVGKTVAYDYMYGTGTTYVGNVYYYNC